MYDEIWWPVGIWVWVTSCFWFYLGFTYFICSTMSSLQCSDFLMRNKLAKYFWKAKLPRQWHLQMTTTPHMLIWGWSATFLSSTPICLTLYRHLLYLSFKLISRNFLFFYTLKKNLSNSTFSRIKKSNNWQELINFSN